MVDGAELSLVEALDKYLDAQSAESRMVHTALLRALAYAKGDGINDDLWLDFAQAVNGRRFERSDLEGLRDSQAADFLVQITHGSDGSATRLFGQALSDRLLSPDRDSNWDRAVLQAVLAQANGPNRWAGAGPYARTHAADHAADCGELPVLLEDLDFVIPTVSSPRLGECRLLHVHRWRMSSSRQQRD